MFYLVAMLPARGSRRVSLKRNLHNSKACAKPYSLGGTRRVPGGHVIPTKKENTCIGNQKESCLLSNDITNKRCFRFEKKNEQKKKKSK